MELTKLTLLLRCTTSCPSDETNREKVYVRSLSEITLSEMKVYIQKKYNIPSCVQLIKWAGVVLYGNGTLESYGLQENDELEVKYHSKGDCEMIEDSVNWMQEVIQLLRKEGVPTQSNRFKPEKFLQLSSDQQEAKFRKLWAQLFQPWRMAKKYTNKLYFIELKGLDMLIELYSFVLTNEWQDTPSVLKYTEFLLVHSFWSFSETFTLQRLAIKKGAIELFVRSLQRLEVDPHKIFKDKTVSGDDWLIDGVPDLNDIADGALGVLSNFCELPEGRDFLASRHDFLEHLLNIMVNHGFTSPVNVSVAEIMMQVSVNPDSHSFLAQKSVVKTLLDNPYFWENRDDPRFECLSMYFSMQCISRVLLVSPQLFSWLLNDSTIKMTVLIKISRLVEKNALKDIMRYEDEAGYLWYTLLPNVTVLYRPLQINHFQLCELQMAAQDLFTATLSVILGRSDNTEVLVRERLVDYIVCLPWFTSGTVHKRAKELVAIVREAPDVPYQPPSLLNMAKGAVSVYYCGLDDVMRLSVPELARKIFGLA